MPTEKILSWTDDSGKTFTWNRETAKETKKRKIAEAKSDENFRELFPNYQPGPYNGPFTKDQEYLYDL